jgi:hypothetical protein
MSRQFRLPQLVLFAENLAIPPTGLLTVRDGDDVYQVRFKAPIQMLLLFYEGRNKRTSFL